MNTPPILWSIAGTDSGGGAGLSADQRAADAFGVHLCPVVAAVTAQSTTAVTRIDAVPPDLLDAQLAALAEDLPPAVIKTGLLGSAANARVVARWVDRLRTRAPLAFVIDPVLRASTGAGFVDEALMQAYRDELLPRATAITPNQHEAVLLLGPDGDNGVPAMASALRSQGVQAVLVTGGDAATPGLAHDWIDTPHARRTPPHWLRLWRWVSWRPTPPCWPRWRPPTRCATRAPWGAAQGRWWPAKASAPTLACCPACRLARRHRPPGPRKRAAATPVSMPSSTAPSVWSRC